MTVGRMLAALSACLLLAACGGSSPHASSIATSSAGTATGTATGTAGGTAGAGAGAVAPAGSTAGTSTSRSSTHAHSRPAAHSGTAPPPPVSRTSKSHKHRAPAGAGNGSGGATLPAFFLIQPGGSLSPATVPAPARALIALGVANHDHAAHTVVLVADGRHTLHVAAGAGTNTVIKPLPAGSYRILIDGRPRGRLVVGTQGGP